MAKEAFNTNRHDATTKWLQTINNNIISSISITNIIIVIIVITSVTINIVIITTGEGDGGASGGVEGGEDGGEGGGGEYSGDGVRVVGKAYKVFAVFGGDECEDKGASV
ncbi:MAG: hypothetical protein LE180_04425 [Endomicrobium sp.]|nr:hypothetical protein [Endomicrobium sp.]